MLREYIYIDLANRVCFFVGVFRRRGTKVHSTNAVVLESLSSSDQPRDDSDMGNKSGRFSPPEKQNGKRAIPSSELYVWN